MGDALDLFRYRRHETDSLEWFVLDIADAYHNIPMRKSERRYACGMVDGRYVVFGVLCMGGKSAPTIWGRFGAAIGRVVSSVADPARFRMEVYVDDPLLASVGSTQQRTLTFTKSLLVLAVLGFPLAWAKASLGTSIVWRINRLVTNRLNTYTSSLLN